MTVNGMGVAAKFILREPPLEVSKKDMPGQPSSAPGGFGFVNGASPAHDFGSGYVPDWGYDSGYDSGYGTVHGSGDGSDSGFGSGHRRTGRGGWARSKASPRGGAAGVRHVTW